VRALGEFTTRQVVAEPAAVLRLAEQRSWNTLEKHWQLVVVTSEQEGESAIAAAKLEHSVPSGEAHACSG
jgi:hypothetical protein